MDYNDGHHAAHNIVTHLGKNSACEHSGWNDCTPKLGLMFAPLGLPSTGRRHPCSPCSLPILSTDWCMCNRSLKKNHTVLSRVYASALCNFSHDPSNDSIAWLDGQSWPVSGRKNSFSLTGRSDVTSAGHNGFLGTVAGSNLLRQYSRVIQKSPQQYPHPQEQGRTRDGIRWEDELSWLGTGLASITTSTSS